MLKSIVSAVLHLGSKDERLYQTDICDEIITDEDVYKNFAEEKEEFEKEEEEEHDDDEMEEVKAEEKVKEIEKVENKMVDEESVEHEDNPENDEDNRVEHDDAETKGKRTKKKSTAVIHRRKKGSLATQLARAQRYSWVMDSKMGQFDSYILGEERRERKMARDDSDLQLMKFKYDNRKISTCRSVCTFVSPYLGEGNDNIDSDVEREKSQNL